MKKILILTILTLSFWSCRQSESLLQEPKISYLNVANLDLSTINLSFNPKSSVANLHTEVLQEDFNKLLQNLNTRFSNKLFDGQLPYQIVLYNNSKNINRLDVNNLYGISLFFNIGTMYEHKLYRVENNVAVPEEEFTAIGDVLYLSDLSKIATFLNQKEPKWALLKEYKDANKQLRTSSNATSSINGLGSKLSKFRTTAVPSCSEMGCSGLSYGYCKQNYSNETIYCETETSPPTDDQEPICPTEQVINFQGGNLRINIDGVDKKEAYDFRDNFLKNTEKGQAYIRHYYNLSKVMKEVMNAENFSKHLAFAKATFEVSETLEKGENNKVPLKESYVNEAFEFIKIYRKAAKDKETMESLNEIEHDLKEFKGKSKEKILNSIK